MTFHIDPEDDEEVAQGHHLGLHGELEASLRAAWSDVPEAKASRRFTLHYLDGASGSRWGYPSRLSLAMKTRC